MKHTQELEQLTERLIEREIYCRANRVIETLSGRGLLEPEAWDNITFENEEGDQEYKEVYEHYFVSDWLAEKLLAIDEPILTADCLDFKVWGRTVTGQAISLDGTFQQIAKGINASN